MRGSDGSNVQRRSLVQLIVQVTAATIYMPFIILAPRRKSDATATHLMCATSIGCDSASYSIPNHFASTQPLSLQRASCVPRCWRTPAVLLFERASPTSVASSVLETSSPHCRKDDRSVIRSGYEGLASSKTNLVGDCSSAAPGTSRRACAHLRLRPTGADNQTRTPPPSTPPPKEPQR